jgi:GIY-YIG catalytic domain
MKERPYIIYALIDPRDGAIRYIGITNNPDQRLEEHLNGRGNNPLKREWVYGLRRLGLAPIMQPLETGLSLPAALERESFLIQHYLNSGNALVNLRVTPYLSYITRKNIPPNEAVVNKSPGRSESRITRRKVTVKLDELIAEAGLSMSELAGETGINLSYLKKICHGKPTTRDVMLRLLRVIGSRLGRYISLDIIEGINILE